MFGLECIRYIKNTTNYLYNVGSTRYDPLSFSWSFFKLVENQPLVLVLYVDEIFLTGEERLIIECKRELTLEFEMK